MKLEIPKMERLQDGTDLVLTVSQGPSHPSYICSTLCSISFNFKVTSLHICKTVFTVMGFMQIYHIPKEKASLSVCSLFSFPRISQKPLLMSHQVTCLLIYLFLAALGLHCCTQTFSSCDKRGYFLIKVFGLLTEVASPIAEQALRTCASVAVTLSSRAQAQQLWHMGLVAPRHVGSSQTRCGTHVLCIDRGILNHLTTREVLTC